MTERNQLIRQARKVLRERIAKAVERDCLGTEGRGFRTPRTRAEHGESDSRAVGSRPMGRNVNAFGHGKPALLRSNRQRRGQAVPL